jgi:CDP-paratose 2-epimerase
MKILITGVCGFVGCLFADEFLKGWSGIEIVGMDNLIRPGSELNRRKLLDMGVKFIHGDIRNASDLDSVPPVDWVLDAAANPSVLAAVDGRTSSRQLVEHNLGGTINMLEFCKKHRAGFTLLSTSRVYSIPPLCALQVERVAQAYRPVPTQVFPDGVTIAGISETYSTAPPVSLYGATKLASECLALEYGETFSFPVWINRCGVLAGAGQFGRADQGIFSYWIHSWVRRQPLKYIGFDGLGSQARDCLHPRDLVPLLRKQMDEHENKLRIRLVNVSGGISNSMSLAQLSEWCAVRFGPHKVDSDTNPRPFDIPWMVLDSNHAARQWNWQPETPLDAILEEIARHAEDHPNWLDISTGSSS